MNDRRNSNHDDPLERASRAYHNQEVPEGPPPEFVAEMLASLQQAEEGGITAGNSDLTPRSYSMNRSVRYAVAATILIALAGLAAWLMPSQGSALAFEKVAEAIANIRSATCKLTLEREPPEEKGTGQVMFLAPFRERKEIDVPGTNGKEKLIHLYDAEQGKYICFVREQKFATVANIENLPADQRTNSFERMRRLVADASRGAADEVEKLGRQTIDGRPAAGFRIIKDNTEQTIWADPKTGLPIRVEFKRRTGSAPPLVWSDFRINVDLDESLFSMDVPEGFTVVNLDLDASAGPTVEDLVPALRLAAEHNDGKFPASLRNPDALSNFLLTGIQEQGEEAARKAMLDFMPKIARATEFLATKLTPESDWHYAGKGATLGTPGRPICWYRPDSKTDYKVVYADLSVKQISAANLPKVIGSLGKAEEPAEP